MWKTKTHKQQQNYNNQHAHQHIYGNNCYVVIRSTWKLWWVFGLVVKLPVRGPTFHIRHLDSIPDSSFLLMSTLVGSSDGSKSLISAIRWKNWTEFPAPAWSSPSCRGHLRSESVDASSTPTLPFVSPPLRFKNKKILIKLNIKTVEPICNNWGKRCADMITTKLGYETAQDWF